MTRSSERVGAGRLVAGATLASGAFMMIAGFWALLRPQGFADYVEFANHEHFLHDAGAFQIGVGAGLFAAVLWRDALTLALAVVLIANTIHTVNHFTDLDIGGRESDPWLLAGASLVAAGAFAARARQAGWVPGKPDGCSAT